MSSNNDQYEDKDGKHLHLTPCRLRSLVSRLQIWRAPTTTVRKVRSCECEVLADDEPERRFQQLVWNALKEPIYWFTLAYPQGACPPVPR